MKNIRPEINLWFSIDAKRRTRLTWTSPCLFTSSAHEKKFLYLCQCEEYDIVEIIVREVNEMYNRRNELIDKYIFL